MAFSFDHNTFVFTIPKTDLTHVVGTLYKYDTEAFREEMISFLDSEEGIPLPDTHDHNTTALVVGILYARAIVMRFPYTITFEDGQYSVILEGSNNNIFDVEGGILNQNQVQIIPGNSAGLIIKEIGSGVTEQDKLDIAEDVWEYER